MGNLTVTTVCERIQISCLGDHLLIDAEFLFFFFFSSGADF